ncbi:MAG: sensor histidine kinase [Leptolyngbyaceae cyanobacterium]
MPSAFKRFVPKRIGRQIGFGYLIAIAVGWTGSILGIMVADYFQGQGIVQLLDAQAQARLLIEFEETLAQAQLNATRAVIAEANTTMEQQERAALTQNLAALSSLLQQLELFLAGQPAWIAQEAEALITLLEACIEALYQQRSDLLVELERGDQADFSPWINSQSGETLDQLTAELTEIIRVAQAQEAMAADVMETAQGFEKFLVISSITLAGLLAGLLAWRTTRAISRPMEEITQVAQRVALDADYSARTVIYSDDEVGVLARSLNELIEQVTERTQSLEAAAQTAITQNQELENTLRVLRKAQLQLIQAEKMSSLGQLVAGIAHEINNPIGFMQGNVEYARDYSQTLFETIDRLQVELSEVPETLVQFLEERDIGFIRQDFPKVLASIKSGTERINNLVLSLKVFSRLQESQLKRANLNDGLESTLLLLGHRLKSQAKRPSVTVMRNYSTLPEIECYSSQLNQVFINIMNNALDAIDNRWETDSHAWDPILRVSTAVENGKVQVRIANNGTPIPESIQAKIFDPFFTTKKQGQGIGLGMSLSYEIVQEKHQGNISFVSPAMDDVGAEFHLEIPTELARPEAITSQNDNGCLSLSDDE